MSDVAARLTRMVQHAQAQARIPALTVALHRGRPAAVDAARSAPPATAPG